MASSTLGKALIQELKNDVERGHQLLLLEQDDDVTSFPDPLSNPTPRRSAFEDSYVS